MSLLKPLARILGPKGLMPNSKVGTLVKVEDLE
jgi:ribosomal protein L1